jgi:hypothetical protein
LFIHANRYSQHRRSDACTGRPIPTPERCDLHARSWPCAACDVVELAGLGFRPEGIATRMGVSTRYVKSIISELEKRIELQRRVKALAPLLRLLERS